MAHCHSTLTRKGQTTVPIRVREALGIKSGDRLEYAIEGDRVLVRAAPSLASLAGALASSKGKHLSFAQIRAAAASATLQGRQRHND